MRKTSDIAMLLGSRGKSRSRSSRGGLGASFLGAIDGLLGRFGKNRRGGRRSDRGQTVPVIVFAIGLLVAFGGGFLLGDRLGGADGSDSLDARVGQKPVFLKELDAAPLEKQAFIVTAYPVNENMDEATAQQKASDLASYLYSKGLKKARPYAWPGKEGAIWVTAVYFSGKAEERMTRDRLFNTPEDVPDELFCKLRNDDSQWPTVMDIR